MKQAGFTLVELLITVMVVGILAGIALPSFNFVIANNQMSSTANNVVGAFNLARAEAAQRGVRVAIGSQNATTNWGNAGYRIWVDADSDAVFDVGELEVRRFDAVATGLTLTSTVAATSFNGVGFATAGATLNLCTNEAAVDDRQVSVTLSGRVDVADFVCP